VAVGAIKRKRPRYASEIAKKSGFRFNRSVYELGFIVVNEPYQDFGLSDAIVEKLLATFHERPLFATSSNEFMKNAFEKAGFVRRGDEWPGMNGMLSLWIKDADAGERKE
jgi:predicted GNAT family N-acyltransferase